MVHLTHNPEEYLADMIFVKGDREEELRSLLKDLAKEPGTVHLEKGKPKEHHEYNNKIEQLPF